jgi:hypothetical protein
LEAVQQHLAQGIEELDKASNKGGYQEVITAMGSETSLVQADEYEVMCLVVFSLFMCFVNLSQ